MAFLGGHDVLRLAGDAELVVAVGDRNAELALDYPEVLVKGAEDADYILHAVYRIVLSIIRILPYT